jgi:broad specificity phosphatase PhoE
MPGIGHRLKRINLKDVYERIVNMTWFILRHGEKEEGEFRNSQVPLNDQPISQVGLEQARNLQAFFANKEIAHIYVSAYQRTGQTIAYVAEHFGLTPVVDERLNEINIGAFENATQEEVEEKFPAEWQAYLARSADFCFPGGESGGEALKRIVEFIDEKQELHGDENVIAVCHDGLIRALMCYVMGIPVYKRWNFRVDTCGITELNYQPDYGTWKLIRFNQTCM